MQTLLDPGLRPASNPRHALNPTQAETPPETPSARRKRNEGGFTMNELLVVLIIIGTLGLIGTGVYFLFIRDARDTVLNANIQTAAEELQSVLALSPSLATTTGTTGVPGDSLLTEMTSRTNFVWEDDWVFATSDNEANTIRLQFLQDGGEAHPTTGPLSPNITWLTGTGGAARLHLANSEGEWRCALIVLKPSVGGINSLDGVTTGAAEETEAEGLAAAMRGTWYDGGSTIATDGLHDCSPVAQRAATGTINAAASTAMDCAVGTAGAMDNCIASDAQTWVIPYLATASTYLDATSTEIDNHRTLHRSPSQLDGE